MVYSVQITLLDYAWSTQATNHFPQITIIGLQSTQQIVIGLAATNVLLISEVDPSSLQQNYAAQFETFIFNYDSTTQMAVADTTDFPGPTFYLGPNLEPSLTQALNSPGTLITNSTVISGTNSQFNFQFQATYIADEEEGGTIIGEMNAIMNAEDELNQVVNEAILITASQQPPQLQQAWNPLDSIASLLGVGEQTYQLVPQNDQEMVEVNIPPYGDFIDVPLQEPVEIYTGPKISPIDPFIFGLLMPPQGFTYNTPNTSTADSEALTAQIINQMRQRDGYQPLVQTKSQEPINIEQQYQRQPLSLFVQAAKPNQKKNNKPPKEEVKQEVKVEAQPQPNLVEGIENKIEDARQNLINTFNSVEGLTKEDIQDIQNTYFISSQLGDQLGDLLVRLYPEQKAEQNSFWDYFQGVNTPEQQREYWKAKVLSIFRTPLLQIANSGAKPEVKKLVNEIINNDKLVFDTIGAIPHIGLQLIQEHENESIESPAIQTTQWLLNKVGIQTETTAKNALYDNLVSSVREFVELPLAVQSEIKYAVQHFGLDKFTDADNLADLITRIDQSKLMQLEEIKSKYKKIAPQIEKVYDPFYDLVQQISIQNDNNIYQQNDYSTYQTIALGTIAAIGLQQTLNYLPTILAWYYGGIPAAAANIGNAIVPYQGGVQQNRIGFYQNIAAGVQQGVDMFQQVAQVIPLFNAPAEVLAQQFASRIIQYGQQQLGLLGGNIQPEVASAIRLAFQAARNGGAVDLRAAVRIAEGLNRQFGNVAPNQAAIQAPAAVIPQQVQQLAIQAPVDPLQEAINVLPEVIPNAEQIAAEIIQVAQNNPLQLNVQVDNQARLQQIGDFLQRHGQQFIHQNIPDQAQLDALQNAFQHIQGGIQGEQSQSALATLLFMAAASTIYSSYAAYKKRIPSKDPYGIFKTLDKQMKKQEIPIYNQGSQFKKRKEQNVGKKQAGLILNLAARLFEEEKLQQGKRIYPFRKGKPFYRPEKRRRLDDSNEILPPRIYNYLKDYPNNV